MGIILKQNTTQSHICYVRFILIFRINKNLKTKFNQNTDIDHKTFFYNSINSSYNDFI